MSEERFDRIETRLDRLEHGQETLRVEVGDLRAEVGDLRRHMGVLHEEVIDRLQTLAFDPAPLRREFRAGDAALRAEFNRRIEPLETAMRRRRRR